MVPHGSRNLEDKDDLKFDSEEELVSFTPGDPAEVSGNPIDRTRAEVRSSLVRADDFQPVFSTNDGDMNFDAGTGGTITLRLYLN